MFSYQVLNTVLPEHIDGLVKIELSKRVFGGPSDEHVVEIQEDLQELFKSPLFPVGLSRMVSKLRKR